MSIASRHGALPAFLAAFALAGSAILASCSSVAVDPSPPPTNPVAAFAAAYGSSLCDRQVACSGLADYLAQACPKTHNFDYVQQAVAQHRTSFDQASATACVAVVTSLGCNTLATLGGSIPNSIPVCGQVFQGQVPPGSPCYVDEECADGTCTGLDLQCPGVCQAKKHFGDPCTTQDCGYSSSACLGTDVCGAIGQLGEPCFTQGYESCTFGAQCLNNVCAPYAQKGESCVMSLCGGDLICKGNVCIEPPAEGAACRPDCGENLVCAGFWTTNIDGGTSTPGTCKKPAELGGPCIENQGGYTISGCATGLDCVGGSCAMPPSSGPCGPSGCAPGHYCGSQGECVPKDPDGTSCAVNGAIQCAGGACVAGLCASMCLP